MDSNRDTWSPDSAADTSYSSMRVPQLRMLAQSALNSRVRVAAHNELVRRGLVQPTSAPKRQDSAEIVGAFLKVTVKK